MNENNDVFTMEDEPIASVMQDMRKGSKWLSAFLESYRPPLDGERYLTDGEVAELLRVSRRTLQEYRNNRVLPFILLGGKVLYPEKPLFQVLLPSDKPVRWEMRYAAPCWQSSSDRVPP